MITSRRTVFGTLSLMAVVALGLMLPPLARSDAWLSELDTLLAAHPDHIQWRAIHLNHAPSGVEQL